MRVIRPSEWRTQPWKNGAGTTHELVRWPDNDDWSVRISVADVTAPAPFSAFPGIERWLYLLAGGPVTLAIAERPSRTLHAPGHGVRFAGEAAVAASAVAQPSRDLNFMVRRASFVAQSERARPGARGNAVFAIAGDVEVEGIALAPQELAWSPERPLALHGSGLAIALAFVATR